MATLIPEQPSEVSSADLTNADVVEVRLEGLQVDQIAPAIEAVQDTSEDSPPAVLATCRRAEDGAGHALEETERRDRLKRALEVGAALVDVERDAPFREEITRQAHRNNVLVVASEHQLEQTPPAERIVDRLEHLARCGDIAKLATRASGAEDVHALLAAGLKAPAIGAPFALMGVGDSALRALAGPLGQALVYANPEDNPVSGQLPLDLQARLPARPPTPQPRDDYVLIGHPVAHSLSPPMQEAAFTALGLPARYRLIDAPPEALATVIDGLAVDAEGGNVTAPHKIALFDRAEHATEEARKVGAANTFRFDGEDRQLRVHMTDGLGVRDALERSGQSLDARPVLLLGAGGTARAVAHALSEQGAQLTLANRTRKTAETLAQDVGVEVAELEPEALGRAHEPGGIIVNATPVDPPVPEQTLARAVAFDANYGHRAAFARRARQAGAKVFDGLDLLVAQGVRSLAFWLADADEEPGEDVRAIMQTAARTSALERRFGRESA